MLSFASCSPVRYMHECLHGTNYIVYFTLIIVVKKIAIPFKKFIFGNHIWCTSRKYVVNLHNETFSLPLSCTYILQTIFFQYVHSKIEYSMHVLLYLHCNRTFHTTKKIFLQGYVESWYTSTRLLVRSTSKRA